MAVLVSMVQAMSERLSGGENVAQGDGLQQDEGCKMVGESADNVSSIA